MVDRLPGVTTTMMAIWTSLFRAGEIMILSSKLFIEITETGRSPTYLIRRDSVPLAIIGRRLGVILITMATWTSTLSTPGAIPEGRGQIIFTKTMGMELLMMWQRASVLMT